MKLLPQAQEKRGPVKKLAYPYERYSGSKMSSKSSLRAPIFLWPTTSPLESMIQTKVNVHVNQYHSSMDVSYYKISLSFLLLFSHLKHTTDAAC